MTALFFALSLFSAVPARAASAVAGSVVSSKEWKVRRGEQKEEEFIGDVRYRSGATIFNADWALFKHASQSWRAKGRVKVEHLLESGDDLVAHGDEAVYDQVSQKGTMTAKKDVTFDRTPRDEETDHGRADRVEWSGKDQIAAIGSVRLWGTRMLTWSDRADFANDERTLKLTGNRPVLVKLAGFDPTSSDWVGALQGDTITSYETPRRLTADGRARGWLDFTKKKDSSGGKQ